MDSGRLLVCLYLLKGKAIILRMASSLLHLFYFLLLLLTSLGQYSIPVLIFGNDFDNQQKFIEQSFIEQFGSTIIQRYNVSIEAKIIEAGSLNRSSSQLMSETICPYALNNSVTVILYSSSISTAYLRLSASAAFALGFYRMPMIAVGLREAELSKERLYPSIVACTPSFADEATVFLQLLTTLGYRQVSLITMRGDSNGRRFAERFFRDKKEHKIHVQRRILLEPKESINASLTEHFEDITSNIILLFAIKKDAERIFADADWLTRGKVWIVNEDASWAKNVPEGVIAPRLNLDLRQAFRDSLTTLSNGMNVLTGTEQPPQGCTKRNDLWSFTQANRIYSALCSTRTSKIRFNNKCRRELVDYDIINVGGGERNQIGAMHGDILELFTDEEIVWPGGRRPFEISLPRHLRVVIVSDPPFVYATPAPSKTHCENLSLVSVRLSPTQIIPVKGRWYYCPRYIGGSGIRREHFCCAGYAIDLLVHLSQPPSLNTSNGAHHLDTSFTFELRLISSYGSVLASSQGGFNLSGAIQLLDQQEADAAIGAITINPEREQFVDFSEPWMYHGIRIVEKATPRASPMQSFLQPLRSSLWTALLVAVLAVGIVIYCLDRNSPFKIFYKEREKNSEDSHVDTTTEERVDLGEAMWFVWGVLLNSGVSEKTPRSGSARVLAVVWCGFCMIVIASYTANLAAFLVLDQPEKSLTGIADPRLRNPSANFSFGTVLHSNVYQYFKRHVELSTMFRKMESHNVERVEDAINSLLRGSLDAFIWDSNRIDWEVSRRCELRPRGSLFGRSAYGVALQKGSAWTPHITTAILTMAESGAMELLDHKWIGGTNVECTPDVIKSPDRLGLSSMRDLFVLLSVAVTLGAILSFVEVSFGRHRTHSAQNRKLALRYGRRWYIIVKKRIRNKTKMERISGYDMQTIVYRRGFAGLQTVSLEEAWTKDLTRRNEELTLMTQGKWKPRKNFDRLPCITFCTRCRGMIETEIERKPGLFAILSILFMSIFLLWPCAPLPCYLPFFSDTVHVCPVCRHKIARVRRIGRTAFYV